MIYVVIGILLLFNSLYAQDNNNTVTKISGDKWDLAGSIGPTRGIVGKEKWGLEISIFNMQNYYNGMKGHEINHWYNQLGGVIGFENAKSNEYLKLRLGVEFIPRMSLVLPEVNVCYSSNGKVGMELRTTLLHLIFVGVDVPDKEYRMGLMFKIPIPPPTI
jgi:hypothetical protein